MKRFLLPLVGFGLVAVVLAIGIQRAPEKSYVPSPLVGKLAPVFSLPSLTDAARKVSNSDFRGRWYVVNIWGTWCVECRAEHAMLLEIKRSGALPIVGLNWKDDEAQALDWIAQLGNPYDAIAVDRDGRTAIDWGAYAAPETFLVDPQGIVVHKHFGAMTREAWEHEFLARVPSDKMGKL